MTGDALVRNLLLSDQGGAGLRSIDTRTARGDDANKGVLGMNRIILSAGVILAVMCASSFAGTNLLTNPGFEDAGGSYNGWTTFGSGPNISITPVDTVRTGLAASKIFGEFGAGFSVGGYFQAFTPTAGNLYEFSGHYLMSSLDSIPGTNVCDFNRVVAQVAFYDDNFGGVLIGRNEVLVGDYNTVQDVWHSFSISMHAPSAATRVQCFILFLQPGTDTGAVYFDDLSFGVSRLAFTASGNMIANPGFDTGLAGWQTFGNVYADGRVFARYSTFGAAKMFGPFSTAGATSVMVQAFVSEPGKEYQFSTRAMTTCEENPIAGTDSNFVSLKLVFKDAVGVEIANVESTIVDNNSPLGTWQEFVVDGTAPAGTDSVCAYIIFVQTDSTHGGAAYIDDVGLREKVITAVPGDIELRSALHQNVPNPFNPTTRISFELDDPDDIEMTIYDATGSRVTTLIRGYRGAGPHSVTWDGRDSRGTRVASGVYWYSLKTSRGQSSRKMVLLK
jgi:hypothetical protein